MNILKIKIQLFLLFLTAGIANSGFSQEITTDEFFEEMRRVESRQSKFLEEKAEIEEILETFEGKRKKAFENYARVSGTGDSVAMQEARSEYILIRSKMIDEEHKMVKKALNVYFRNAISLNNLYKKFKDEADHNFEGSPKDRITLRTDLARLSFFIENLKNISRTLGQPGAILSRDSGLKAKMDATSMSARSILRFINFENKRSGPNPSNAALTALEKHISTVETGYLAYKDHFRALEREKERARIAIRVARSELGILTLGGQNSFPALKQDYDHKNKIHEQRGLEDEQILF